MVHLHVNPILTLKAIFLEIASLTITSTLPQMYRHPNAARGGLNGAPFLMDGDMPLGLVWFAAESSGQELILFLKGSTCYYSLCLRR